MAELTYKNACIMYLEQNMECVNYRDYIIEQLNKLEQIEQILDIESVLTIPENPTNGDMIKTLFPNITFTTNVYTKDIIASLTKFKEVTFSSDWWNAPYKENTDEKG